MKPETEKVTLNAVEDFYRRVNTRAEASMMAGHRLEGSHCRAMEAELRLLRERMDPERAARQEAVDNAVKQLAIFGLESVLKGKVLDGLRQAVKDYLAAGDRLAALEKGEDE